MKQLIIVAFIALIGFAFTSVIKRFSEEPLYVPPSEQRTGDSAKGYEYLTTGDYVKGGIPYNMFILGMGKDRNHFLNRPGFNKKISHEFTAVQARNGEWVVAPNCLQCHAQVFDDSLIVGLGNSLADFTPNKKLNARNLERVGNLLKITAPRKYEAAEAFIQVGKTIGPLLHTEVKGVNPADRLAAVLAAHRDPETFAWSDSLLLPIPESTIPTDVPAWWLLKKKNAMFYNGFGRGDFGRFLMASNLLTVKDTSESAEVDKHMPDLLSYIYSLQPPKYPGNIDEPLANTGRQIFEKKCSGCHGKYGAESEYPNLLIPASMVQTDSMLCSSNYSSPQFIDWFNKSWFTKGDHPARLEPFNGYIAPPLDGVWITAPYFHNGSVPTLEALLNSSLRPKYWSRDFDHPKYDYEKLGWQYKTESKPGPTSVYNTDLPGYGNYGHNFGDNLTDEERRALLEYLKTI